MEPSQLSPNFVIPVGTQVVLLKDLDVFGLNVAPGQRRPYRKAGSVGVVAEAPLTSEYAYVVRFADGNIVRAKRGDLAVRRTDAPEDSLPSRDISAYEPCLIYRVRMGSKAFGLDDEASDDDERGVFLPPAEWHWSLQSLPEQIEFKRLADGRVVDHGSAEPAAQDACWWEIEKSLRMALKANPNVLETLYAPDRHVLYCDAIGRELRELRQAFMSKYIYRTYSGYVLSQFRKMRKEVDAGREFRPKHAMHLIRLLYSGIEAVRGHGILVDVGVYRQELLRIKRQQIPFGEVHAKALELDRVFQEEYDRTSLPDRPDVAAVDRFLIGARRRRTV